MLDTGSAAQEPNRRRWPLTRNGRRRRHSTASGRLVALCMAAGVLLLARPSAAATFDVATGKLQLDDGAAVAVSFDDAASIPTAWQATFWGADGEPVEAEFVSASKSLEGGGALSFGGPAVEARFELASLWTELSGRRVELRIWQQAQGTRAEMALAWGVGDLFAVAQEGQGGVLFGILPLQPTGRATTDGWREYTSGPFDFSVPGERGPAVLYVGDLQRESFGVPSATARVHIDALELVDLGPALVPDGSCTVLDEASTCGPEGLCAFGRCLDAAIVAGPVLRDELLRNDYLTRRLHEIQMLEGGRIPQHHMAQLALQLDALRSNPTAGAFWPGIQEGVEQLWDGHAVAPLMSYSFFIGVNFGICVHLGEADWTPNVTLTPLVFESASSNPVASLLQPGDALVAIDGQPPFHWAEHARRLIQYNGDPQGYEQVIAPSLVRAAIQTGATLTFARCPQAGPDPVACSPTTVQTIDIDMAAVFADELFAGKLPDWHSAHTNCDYRFGRAIDHPEVREYSFAGYADEGPIRTLIINGVPNRFDDGGLAWWTTVESALSPPPGLLILDQRKGRGGAPDTVDFLMGMLLLDQNFHRMELLPSLERPLDPSMWTTFTSCDWTGGCGGYAPWALGTWSQLGPLEGVAGQARVAVLNARDASGNDFTSKLATYRSADTRIFSAAPTYGAFGPIHPLPPHIDEAYAGTVQLLDTIFVAQPGDPVEEFTTGMGVPPDQLVWQRQSDAVMGVDTVVEAAKAWLTEEGPP